MTPSKVARGRPKLTTPLGAGCRFVGVGTGEACLEGVKGRLEMLGREIA